MIKYREVPKFAALSHSAAFCFNQGDHNAK